MVLFVCFFFSVYKTKNVLNLTVRCSPKGLLSVSAVFGEHNVLCRAMPCLARNQPLPACHSAVESSVLLCSFPVLKGWCLCTYPALLQQGLNNAVKKWERQMVPALQSLQPAPEPAPGFPEHFREILGASERQQGVLPAALCSWPEGRQLCAGSAALPGWGCATGAAAPDPLSAVPPSAAALWAPGDGSWSLCPSGHPEEEGRGCPNAWFQQESVSLDLAVIQLGAI